MADVLSLLFELDTDPNKAVAGFKRARVEFAREILTIRKLLTQPFQLPSVKPVPTSVPAGGRGTQADSHVKEFRRIEAEAAKSVDAQEKGQRRLNAAVESLQRQRSTALIRTFKDEERAAVASAQAQERAVAASFKAQERAALAAAKAQERAGREAAARLARTPQSDQQVRDFLRIEAEKQKAAVKSAQIQEREERRLVSASEQLQRQRNAAIVRAARQSSTAQEREQRRLNSAVLSLQRQRSAALIRAFKDEERAAIASARAQERAAQQASRAITNAFRGIGPGLQSLGRTLTVGITATLLALGAVAIKSAKDLDANVNTLKAFTGSAEAAERRLAQLIKTARDTPGLTTNLALTLDAQLRIAQTTQETIDRVLPAIGRLNAVSKLPDAARFTQNLLQLITQNFEKQDLKELVGQSPLAGQLITEIFNVDSPTNAEAIRKQAQKLGLTTVDAFFNAFAEAAAKNQGLATVTESIGTRFDKIVDRVTVALRPLGLAILKVIEPFIEPVANLIERLGAAFDSLSTPVKTAIIVIAGIAAAAGPVLIVLGSLATGIAAVVSAIGTISAAVAAVGLPVIAVIVAGIVIEIGKWVVVLGALGLAFKTNFLNIRGLTKDAATAILDAFNRIKGIVNEVSQRILPTLQSITTKVLAIITLAWETFGKDIVTIVGTAFRFITAVTETFLKVFGDFVDLILKLIDGDFRGAFNAFARILVTALDAFDKFQDQLFVIAIRAFTRLTALILQAAVKFTVLGQQLAVKLITAFAKFIVDSNTQIRDALIEALTLAVAGLDPSKIAAVFIARFVAAIRKAAQEGVQNVGGAPVIGAGVFKRNVGGEPVIGAGILRTKKSGTGTTTTETDKGADAETRRRIRLLELEAEKAEAIARQGIAAENILFEQRRTSLKEFTEFQLRQETLVLQKKKEVFAAERAEAEKLGKGRDLALGEIRLKELKADLDFADRKNQLLANQEREELEAAKAHRQALLDLQQQADDAEIARLEDLADRGIVTAVDIANRRAEIIAASFARQKEELERQRAEAGSNVEERQRIDDEIDKLNKASAESVKESEREKRRAILETAQAYRDYSTAIQDALAAANQAVRDAARAALTRSGLELINPREGIRRRFELAKEELRVERQAARDRIDLLEEEAIEKAKRTGDYENRRLQIEETFKKLRRASDLKFAEDRRALEDEQQREIERANPLSARSLFGDRFADISNIFGPVAAAVDSIKQHALEAFAQMGEAFGAMVETWVLTGQVGAGGVRKFVASALASLTRMFFVQSLAELAYGIAALTPWGAAIYGPAPPHFKAAALLGIAAAATGLAGRAVAGSSAQRESGGLASAAVNGGEVTPRNREFQNGALVVEPSSSSVRDGSGGGGGFFANVIDTIRGLQQQTLDIQRQQMLLQGQTAQALTRIQAMRHGDALAIGTAENPGAVGRAVIDHSNSDGDFNEGLSRNLGFAR